MRPIVSLAKAFLLTSLREKNSLFWMIIFPLLLFSLLSRIFGGLERRTMQLALGAVSLDRGPFGESLIRALQEPSLGQLGSPRLFSLRVPSTEDDPASFAEELRKSVRSGALDAALIVPQNFSEKLEQLAFFGKAEEPPQVEILYRRGEAGSSMAAGILEEIAQEYSKVLLIQTGALRPDPPFSVRMSVVGGPMAVKYTDFIFPGFLLMAVFVAGLFSVPGKILFARDMGLLRRYLVSPLSLDQYFWGFFLGYLLLCSFQASLLWFVGRFGFGLSLSFSDPVFFLYLVLGLVVSLGLGFLASSLAKTTGGAFALANLMNLPLQFSGGLYFPLAGLPGPLRALVAINPLTHLAEGMRVSLGIGTRVYPAWVGPLVLAIWVILSLFAFRRLRLGVEG